MKYDSHTFSPSPLWGGFRRGEKTRYLAHVETAFAMRTLGRRFTPMKTKNEELASVAERLAGHLDAIRVHGRRKVKAAWEAGRELLAAKELVGNFSQPSAEPGRLRHGGWIPNAWLKNQGLARHDCGALYALGEVRDGSPSFGDQAIADVAHAQAYEQSVTGGAKLGGGKTTLPFANAVAARCVGKGWRNAHCGGIDLDPLSSAEVEQDYVRRADLLHVRRRTGSRRRTVDRAGSFLNCRRSDRHR